jgi:SAM-dependent methyltransferase
VAEARYIPALRFEWLTGLYDPLVRLTTREGELKRRIADALEVAPGGRVLDLACGTGTLALMIAGSNPELSVAGVDGDPHVLRRARAKAHAAGIGIDFDQGFSTELPYPDASFDAVVSTLFFHHLDRADKERTATEIARVLKPDGSLHVADWGKPSDPLMAAAFLGVRLLDGFDVTRDNAAGELPRILESGGLADMQERGRLRTPGGTIYVWHGRRQARRAAAPAR